MRTRRTKEQIRKDIYNKDVDAYNFYVVNLDTKRAETGFEFREDAVDLLNDYDDKKKYKVVSKKALKTMGIENPNESFKYEAGGDFQAGVYAGGGEVRRFNRHEQMDSETREEVLDVLSDPDLSGYLTNCLYGLFDGYDYSQTEYFKKDMNKLKSKDSKLYNRVVDIYKKIDTYKFEKYDEYSNGGYFDGSIPKVNTYMTNYAKGGSLQAHGIEVGDTFLRTISGAIQKVKDKNGKIVYINLANGERDSQPPLPFEDGGGVGIEEEIDLIQDYRLRVRKPAMPEKKLTEQEWAEKHNAGAYEFMADGGSLQSGSINALSDLWFAVQQKDTDDYKMIANQLDKLKVPYAIQNEVSENAEMQRGRKALNIPEVHERITRIVERNKRKFATGGALVGNQSRIDLNKNGKIDAEDFKLLRSSMNGAYRNERKHVNHDEDYEVRYAKKKPNRTGYKGKRKFANGGGVGQKDSVYFKPTILQSEYPNFLTIIVKYPTGEGFLTALGQKTSSGQERDSGQIKANDISKSIVDKLNKEFNIEDIDVSDNKNGKIVIFAVSDDFVNISKSTLEQKLKTETFENGGRVNKDIEINPTIKNFIDKLKKEAKYNKGNEQKNVNGVLYRFDEYKLMNPSGFIVNEFKRIVEKNYGVLSLSNGYDFRRINLEGNKVIFADLPKFKGGNTDYITFRELVILNKTGGKTTFEEKSSAIAKKFEGKRVEPKYQKEYGKVYSKEEAKEVGNKITGSIVAKDKMATGGGVSNKLTLYKSNYLSTSNKQVLTSKDGNDIYIYENEILYDSPDGKTKGASHRMSKLELNILPFTKLSNQKMATGGESKKGAKGGIMVLAKKIRKDGESWKDALKRAGQQLK